MTTNYLNGHMPPETVMPFRSVLTNLSSNPGAEILRYGWAKDDVIHLGQGQGSEKTPDFITEAAYRAMQEGKTFYGPALGHDELRQELSNYYAKVYGYNLPTGRIFATGSGTTAMHLALTAVLDEEDEVVAVTPIWKNLLGAIELTQARISEVPLEHTEEGWELDLDRLFDSVTHKTKAILIVTPSNPTGWTASRSEIRAITDFARERGIWIISDEVYGRLHFDADRAPSFLDAAEGEDLLLVVNSFSKSYAMTGWRLGWIVGPAKAEEKIRDIALYDNMGPCSFMQYGGIAALRRGESFIRQQMDLWRGNRDLMMNKLGSYDRVKMTAPEATFYGFFRVEGEPDCMAFARRLVDEASLSLAPGCAFGKTSQGYIRLCFAVDTPLLEEALDRLGKIM